TIPIYMEDKVEMILTATYKASDFSKLINITSFDGKGQSMVVDSSGNLVSQVHDINSDELKEIYKFNNKNDTLNILKGSIGKGDEDMISYQYLGEDYLAYYEKVGINDWYLISYAPKKEVYKNIQSI
ncbi:hypothetical protein H9X78_16600, partial [Clostridium saudiense]|nr:hypothetical protein [Clostridium saudiense]